MSQNDIDLKSSFMPKISCLSHCSAHLRTNQLALDPMTVLRYCCGYRYKCHCILQGWIWTSKMLSTCYIHLISGLRLADQPMLNFVLWQRWTYLSTIMLTVASLAADTDRSIFTLSLWHKNILSYLSGTE